MIEHLIDPWESLMRQIPEQISFVDEAMPLMRIEVEYLLENEVSFLSTLNTLIPDQVNDTRGSLAQDTIDTVAFL